MATATVDLEFGNLHPFDSSAGDSTDWAHSAARGIAAMMHDNADMASVMDAMDDQMRTDFIAGIADIIREAQAQDSNTPAPASTDQTAES